MNSCLLLIFHHFFYLLVYVNVCYLTTIKYLSRDRKKKTLTERKLPRSRPDPFPGSRTGLSPELSNIRPRDPIFFGVCTVRSGYPRRSGSSRSSLIHSALMLTQVRYKEKQLWYLVVLKVFCCVNNMSVRRGGEMET